jgi:hypothetical protein
MYVRDKGFKETLHTGVITIFMLEEGEGTHQWNPRIKIDGKITAHGGEHL